MSESSSPTLAHFDADARAEALTIPTLQVGRLHYVGRILSATEWLPWYERYLVLAKKNGKDMAVVRERLAFYRAYLAVVFPRRRLKFWAPDPAALLKQQPGNALAEAFQHFFSLQLSVIAGPADELEATGDQAAATVETLQASEAAPLPAPGNISSGSTPPGSADAPVSAPSA